MDVARQEEIRNLNVELHDAQRHLLGAKRKARKDQQARLEAIEGMLCEYFKYAEMGVPVSNEKSPVVWISVPEVICLSSTPGLPNHHLISSHLVSLR